MSKNKKTVVSPNWFPSSVSTSTQNKESQFSSTRGLRYGPLRINKTGIFVNNGELDSTILNSSGFHGYGLTGNEQITLDASTGLNITDGTNSVLQAIISGTNVGDVVIGAYSDGAGVFYDKSASKFYIKGTLSAVDGTFSGSLSGATGTFSGSISIGSGNNIFKADSNGIYLGNATFASAPFRVTPSGSLTATLGTIGGWTIGATSLYSSDIELESASGGSVLVGDATAGISLLKISGVPYIAFAQDNSIKALLRATTAGSGGLAILDGDLVLNNNKSFLCSGTSGYGSLGVDGSNNFLLSCPASNEFFVKSTNSDTSYFHTTNSHVYINTRSNGNLYIGTGTGKMTMSSNIDMNEKNIDGCDTVWAYHFNTRSEVYKGEPFEVLKSLEISGKSKTGWNKVNHNKVHKDLVFTNDKGEKGYSLDRLIEIQRLAILELKEEINILKLKVYN